MESRRRCTQLVVPPAEARAGVKILSYIVRYDVGFAPNPFHGYCTLATCHSDVRRAARIGDWILGTGSREKKLDGHLVYAMKVSEILSFDEYWDDPRFGPKRADLRGSTMVRFGDNVYHSDTDCEWIQEDSRHSKADGTPEPKHIEKDTRVDRVLISEEFVYFGGQGPAIPTEFRSDFDLVHVRQGFRSNFSSEKVDATVGWIKSLEEGQQGRPEDWPRRRP
jgi:hypothetical protein